MYNFIDDSHKPHRVDTLTEGSQSHSSQETKQKDVELIDGKETVHAEAVTALSSSATTASSTALSSRRSSFEDRAPARLTRFTPPENFGTVVDGKIFRSSYPKEENYSYLQALKLKSILTLVKEDCPESYTRFIVENGIRHYRVHIPANKGRVCITPEAMAQALMVVLDRSNYPLLIHCNKGKHRTGCVVACMEKVLGKNMQQIKEEYHTYAAEKARVLDEQFIDEFDERALLWMARFQGWVPDDEPRSPLPLRTQSPRQPA
ncbi:tyrosine-protein phosphatase siw14 [Botryosphaeria dothidea]